MDYKANVTLMTKPGTLKGVASVSINEEFVVKGVRIYENDKGPFVLMPSRKVGENYEDICFPITAESRNALHNAVIEAYEQKLTQQEEQTNEEGKNDKKSGNKKSQKQSDAPKADENGEEMSEGQEEQTEAGPEMSM